MKIHTLIPTVLIKEAARGDFLLKAVNKAFTPGVSAINPETRMKALYAISGRGLTINNTKSILQGRPTDGVEPGNILKLLTGKGTKNTNSAEVANAVRNAAEAITKNPSQIPDLQGGIKDFTGELSRNVRDITPVRRNTRLSQLSDSGVMDSLRF